MRQMKKRFSQVAVVLLLGTVLLLSLSCGGNEEKSEVSEKDEAVTIRVAVDTNGSMADHMAEQAAAYEKEHPNVTIELVETPRSASDLMGLYLQYFESQSGTLDVLRIDVIWPGDLAEHLLDLNEYDFDSVKKQHFDAIVENNTVDGRFVGLPWFTDAGLLYYRTDLLEKYGYDGPPETWDELEAMAKKIQAGEKKNNQDFWGYVFQGNSYEGLTCNAMEWLYSNGGGRVVEPNGEITINNPKAKEIIAQAASWVGTIAPNGVVGLMEEDSRAIWQAGNAAFMRNWPYAYSLGNSDDSPIKGKFDVAPLPAGDSGSGAATLGGWQMAVNKYSENPEIAADVLRMFCSPESQKMNAVRGSYNPTIKSLYQDKEVLAAAPFFGTLYDVFTNAVARPSTATAPQYAETSRIFYSNVYSVLTGEQDADSALGIMERELKSLLK